MEGDKEANEGRGKESERGRVQGEEGGGMQEGGEVENVWHSRI